jgi:hypothetical protein
VITHLVLPFALQNANSKSAIFCYLPQAPASKTALRVIRSKAARRRWFKLHAPVDLIALKCQLQFVEIAQNRAL